MNSPSYSSLWISQLMNKRLGLGAITFKLSTMATGISPLDLEKLYYME